MGGKVASVVVIIVVGVIIADVITHPKGTAAAANAGNTAWRSTLSGLLGKQPR